MFIMWNVVVVIRITSIRHASMTTREENNIMIRLRQRILHSALTDHTINNSDHNVSWDEYRAIDMDVHLGNRLIKETIHIGHVIQNAAAC